MKVQMTGRMLIVKSPVLRIAPGTYWVVEDGDDLLLFAFGINEPLVYRRSATEIFAFSFRADPPLVFTQVQKGICMD